MISLTIKLLLSEKILSRTKCFNSRAMIQRFIKTNFCTAASDKKLNYIDIPVEYIRNFSIIAHVDHGKSTLADRLLEITGAIKENSGKSQILDKLQVERERGITVKAQSASIFYEYKGQKYLLNLVDTPGHVDFSNEVSRSLSACQGVILLVDANDGVQAQTVANFYLAFGKDLIIIPVLNKIDLKNADPKRTAQQLKTLFDIEQEEILNISAKLGTGITSVIEAIIEKLPHPKVDRSAPFKALIFDSWYDKYRGALSLVYVHNGEIEVDQELTSCYTQKSYQIKSLGILQPDEKPVKKLFAGQVGLIGCNMRSSQEAIIGDTIHKKDQPVKPLEGFKPSRPMVFAGIYPFDQSQHVSLRSAIEKLTLNDSAVTIAIDSSPALGQGWRLGFLGLLHLEVFCQRLEQEYDAEPIITAPSVTYKIKLKPTKQNIKAGKQEIFITNPSLFPEPYEIEETFEPIVLGTIITPDKYLGPVISLCMERRGIQIKSLNIDNERILLQFNLPLCEIVLDFHDKLKTISSGYASFDYEDAGYQSSSLVKLNILLNGNLVDELCTVVHTSRAQVIGKRVCNRLKETIPRQLIQIAIQAATSGRVVARETLKAYRKDVTAKLYGGDVTRRKKLLARQTEGKKRMKAIANISIPRNTFIEVLRRE